MTIITRRTALMGIGSISATVGAGEALAVSGPPIPITPVERVQRLAKELSAALDELNRDAYEPTASDHVGIWCAEVWPTRVRQGLCLIQRDFPAALIRHTGRVA